MEELNQLLEAADSAAVARVGELGEQALPALETRLEHPDSDVRFLVVECLAALGGPAAARLLLPKIEDSSGEIRLEAVNSLLELEPVPGLASELAALYDRVRDGFLRRQLGLVLGRLEPQESRSRLAGRLVDTDLARDGLVAGLARQGDPSARRRLGELLVAAEGERVAEVLSLFRYVGRPEYTVDLLPLIEREEVVADLSSHLHTILRRACDLGIEEFLRLRPGELSFGFRPVHEQYTYTELVEIRALLRREAEEAS